MSDTNEVILFVPFGLESVLLDGNKFQMFNIRKSNRANFAIRIYLTGSPVNFVYTSKEWNPWRWESLWKILNLSFARNLSLNHLI